MSKKFTFKLVKGSHYEGAGKDGKLCKKGDLIETNIDLASRFNMPGNIKFVPCEDGEPVIDVEDDDDLPTNEEGNILFDKMTLTKLKKFAEENEIELGDAKTKAEIIEKLSVWND